MRHFKRAPSCTSTATQRASASGSARTFVELWDSHGDSPHTAKLLPHLLSYFNTSIFAPKQNTHEHCKNADVVDPAQKNIMAFFCAVLSRVLPHWFHRCFRCTALLNMLTHRITISFSAYWWSHGKSKWKTFSTSAVNSCNFLFFFYYVAFSLSIVSSPLCHFNKFILIALIWRLLQFSTLRPNMCHFSVALGPLHKK